MFPKSVPIKIIITRAEKMRPVIESLSILKVIQNAVICPATKATKTLSLSSQTFLHLKYWIPRKKTRYKSRVPSSIPPQELYNQIETIYTGQGNAFLGFFQLSLELEQLICSEFQKIVMYTF